SYADAPEIDGLVHVEGPGTETLKQGDIARVTIREADEYDLYAEPTA
ncbi:hypothetical protein, partial [Synechococcus sp. YX-04-1]